MKDPQARFYFDPSQGVLCSECAFSAVNRSSGRSYCIHASEVKKGPIHEFSTTKCCDKNEHNDCLDFEMRFLVKLYRMVTHIRRTLYRTLFFWR